MLAVIVISSGILVVLATLFKTGLWEVSKSSGRIEMVRNGRNALDNVQRYLSTVMPPSNLFLDTGATLVDNRAIFWPDDDMIHDPPGNVEQWQQRLQFFSPIDHLGLTPMPTARQLLATPTNFAYEIAAVPGPTATSGQDLVLRRLVNPTPWPTTGANAPPPIDNIDTTVEPRLIGRRLGIPESTVPGGFHRALEVRRVQRGAFQIRVNVTVETITDDLNRNRALNATNSSVRNQTNTLTMQTIFQPPYFNIDR
jgi:hypothetical protein